ncbi:MAG: hypothetical protein ACLFQV_02390 [Vulcanimicrobiota bacterium]
MKESPKRIKSTELREAIWQRKPDYKIEEFDQIKSFDLQNCYDIVDNTENCKSCEFYKDNTSCWLYFDECRCINERADSKCEECNKYSKHRRELDSIIRDVRAGKIRSFMAFLSHIEPVIECFINKNRQHLSSTGRKKRVLTRIALKILKDESIPQGITLEQYVYKILKEILGKKVQEEKVKIEK